MLAFGLGTTLFLALVFWLPVSWRVKAYKEIAGPLQVALFLPGRRRPFTWTVPPTLEPRIFSLLAGARPRSRDGKARGKTRRRWPELWRRLNRAANRLYGSLSCRHWELHLRLGAGEAAYTAWLVGSVWAWQARASAVLARRMSGRMQPRFYLEPCFTREGWGVDLNCRLSLRLGAVGLALADLFAAALSAVRPRT
ncbi:MAG: DUF2953 domain-containing protein [Moorellales bacterium]